MTSILSAALLFMLCIAGPALADTNKAPKQLAIELNDSSQWSCTFSHADKGAFGSPDFYVCKKGDHSLILQRSGEYWQTIDRPAGKRAPRIGEVNLVKQGEQTLYAASKIDRALDKLKKPESLDERYRDTNIVESALQSDAIPGKEPPPRKKAGSEEYEALVDDYLKSLRAERKRIEKKFKSAENITLDLSNGQSITCQRGLNDEKMMNQPTGPVFTNNGCELYTCPKVEVGGKKYDALVYQNATPGGFGMPHLTLSRPGELGPQVTVLKSRLNKSSSADDVLFEEFPVTRENAFAPKVSPVPAELEAVATQLPVLMSREWQGARSFARQQCNQKEISELFDQEQFAIKRAEQILAQAQVVQLVDWVNGEFQSQLVPKSTLPVTACTLEDGVYLSPEARQNLTPLEKRFGLVPHKAVSLETAKKLFKKLSEMPDIPFNYLPDGCHARAHIMATRLEKMGVQTEKAWLVGDLVPKKDPSINWRFHVAPSIQVQLPDGKITRMVIDPSVSDRPLTGEEWAALIPSKGKGALTESRFPVPWNAEFYQRPVLSFSPTKYYIFDELGEEENEPEKVMKKATSLNATYLKDQQEKSK